MDTIANALSQIKNASRVNKSVIEVNYSGVVENVANLFKTEGYLSDVRVFRQGDGGGKKLALHLKYNPDGTPAITDLRRVSKSGQRIYATKKNMKDVMNGLGLSVVSTSLGIMSTKEARKRDLGGEIICEVW